MKRTNEEAVKIARHIHVWLNEYTTSLQSNSTHTIRFYRYTISLFLMFLQVVKKIVPAGLCAGCFSRSNLEEWLIWLKNTRKCSAETCNNRLSALRAFLKYLAGKDVAFLFLSNDANQIPRQKIAKKKINGMSKKAMQALMLAPDISTKSGRMYLVLLIVLYNTAARIDEILSAKIKQLNLETKNASITVVGKGKKIRTLPLLPKTVYQLKRFLAEFHPGKPNGESYLFYSRNTGTNGKLSQKAVNKQLKKYAVAAHAQCGEVPINLHAHQIRHAKSSHWLEDGVNIVQISFLLGHASLQTTMEYLDITLEQEYKALATLEDENMKNIPKKWKSNRNSLAVFCGISPKN